MNTNDDPLRTTIALQAGEWFVRNRANDLSEDDRRAFAAWLKDSPLNVEEYLGVALLARELPATPTDPEMPLEVLLERARSDSSEKVVALGTPPAPAHAGRVRRRRRNRVRIAAAASLLAAVTGALFWWDGERGTSQLFATRHGEQQSWRLSDSSVLRLDTDTTVSVRYRRSERRIEIVSGQALFEVAHLPTRPFRVLAGSAEVIAVGTQFNVYRQADSTLVTVVEGQVTVAAASDTRRATAAATGRSLRVSAGEQVRVTAGILPAGPERADLHTTTAWLHRQLAFDRQPLQVVATEFNRYSSLPIEIETPELRALSISGVFEADDIESFIGFLKSLKGVSVEITSTRIRVFRLAGLPGAVPAQPKTH